MEFFLFFLLVKYCHQKRKQLYRLHDRNPLMVFTVFLATLFVILTGTYQVSAPYLETLNCTSLYFLNMEPVILLCLPLLIRLYGFYRSIQLTGILAAQDNRDREETDSVVSPSLFTIHSYSHNLNKFRAFFSCCVTKNEQKEDELRRLRFQRSEFALGILMILILSPYLITYIILIVGNEKVANNCHGCEISLEESIIQAVEGVVAIILVGCFYALNRKSIDRNGFLMEIKLAIWLGAIPAIVCFIANILGGGYVSIALLECFLIIYCFVQSALQAILAIVELNSIKKAEELYSVTFDEFLQLVLAAGKPYNEGYRNLLVAEQSFESLAFLNDVNYWKNNYFSVTETASSSRAKKIMLNYVGDDAITPCNLSSKIVNKMKAKVTSSTIVDFELFDIASKELQQMLFMDSFSRFKATLGFRKTYEQIHQTNSPTRVVIRSLG